MFQYDATVDEVTKKKTPMTNFIFSLEKKKKKLRGKIKNRRNGRKYVRLSAISESIPISDFVVM